MRGYGRYQGNEQWAGCLPPPAGSSGRSCPNPDHLGCLYQRLADMDGDRFCAIVRQHPGVLALPIPLLQMKRSRLAEGPLAAAPSAPLGCPYSIEDLRRILGGLLAGSGHEKIAQAADRDRYGRFDAALCFIRPCFCARDQPGRIISGLGMGVFWKKTAIITRSVAFQRALENAHERSGRNKHCRGLQAARQASITAPLPAWLACGCRTHSVQARHLSVLLPGCCRILGSQKSVLRPRPAGQIRRHEVQRGSPKPWPKAAHLSRPLKAGTPSQKSV